MRKWWNKAKDWWRRKRAKRSKPITVATGALVAQPLPVGWIHMVWPSESTITIGTGAIGFMASIVIPMKGPVPTWFNAPIPDITIAPGETYDLLQYVAPGLNITSSQVIGLDTDVATYESTTGLLTGVAAGTISGAQLEVTYSTAQ